MVFRHVEKGQYNLEPKYRGLKHLDDRNLSVQVGSGHQYNPLHHVDFQEHSPVG